MGCSLLVWRVAAVCLLTCCGVFGTPTQAAAQAMAEALPDHRPVTFVRRNVESAFAREVSVRILGELQALGFRVHVEDERVGTVSAQGVSGDPGVLEPPARMVLAEGDATLVVEAWCPTCDTPLVQTWSNDGSRSAETIAVRSVEALRASLLVYAQQRDRARAVSAAPAPSVSVPLAPSGETNAPREDEVFLRLALGPMLSLQLDPSAWSPGVVGGVSVDFAQGGHTWAFGVRGGGARSAHYLVAEEGQAWVSRWFVDGFVELAPRLSREFELFGQVGAGWVAYDTRSEAANGFVAVGKAHHTLLASVRGGVRFAFAPPWALALWLGAETTLNAPVITFAGRSVATLDHPAGAAGLILSLAL